MLEHISAMFFEEIDEILIYWQILVNKIQYFENYKDYKNYNSQHHFQKELNVLINEQSKLYSTVIWKNKTARKH